MRQKFKRIARQFLGFFPTKLPTGATEFTAWADSFLETYTLPTDHKDSIRFVLATAIMNLGSQTAYKPKYYFYLTITAGCAKQVAGSIFYEIKQKQRAEQEAAEKEAATSGQQQ